MSTEGSDIGAAAPTEAAAPTRGPLAPGTPSVRHRIALLAVLATALLALVACWRYWSVQGLRSYLPDEGIYTFVGWSWLHGDWPYRDTWDHKGPVIFAVTLVRTALLGSAPEMTGIQEIVMGLATSAALAGAAAMLWGILPACMVGFAGVLLWTQLGPTGGHVSTAGSIIALINALCILLTIATVRSAGRWRAWLLFALGLAGGFGFLAKPNAIGAIVAGWIVLFWIGRRSGIRQLLRDWGLLAAGVALAMAVVAVTFAAVGVLPDLIDVAFLYNMKVRGPGILAQYSVFGLAKRIARGLLRLHVLMPVAMVAGITVLALGEHVRKPDGTARFASAEAIAPVWLVLELLIYASNGVYGHHIFPVLFAVAMCMGWMVSITLRLLPADRRAWAFAVVVPLLIWPAGEMARLHRDPDPVPPDWRVVGDRIRAETRPDERVLALARMWGPSILAVAERRTAIRYIHSPPLYSRGYASDERWGEVVALLEGPDAPRFVIIPMWSISEVPEGGPTDEWLVEGLDLKGSATALTDPTPFPNREKTKAVLVERYDVDYCVGGICVLALTRAAAS